MWLGFCMYCGNGIHGQCSKLCLCPEAGCGFVRKKKGGKMCKNCQREDHGKCSMPWCICPLKECQVGYHKVSPMEVAISYFITKQTRSNIAKNIPDNTKKSE